MDTQTWCPGAFPRRNLLSVTGSMAGIQPRYLAPVVSPGGTSGKEPTANAGDIRDLSREDPLEEAWQPIPVFLPGKSHGQKSLAGYSPWGSNAHFYTCSWTQMK